MHKPGINADHERRPGNEPRHGVDRQMVRQLGASNRASNRLAALPLGSLGLDLRILALTLVKVFRREGISADGHATMPEF